MFFITFAVDIIITIISAFDKKYEKTTKGEKIAEEYRGLKEYLKEYTLVKTRNIKYIEILDRYLTFALVLEEADEIEEKFMKFNKIINKYILET